MPYSERTHADALCAPDLCPDPDSVLLLHLRGGFKLVCRRDQIDHSLDAARGLADSLLERLEIFNLKPEAATARLLAAKVEAHLERPPGLYQLSLSPQFELSQTPVTPTAERPVLVFIHGTGSSSRAAFLPLADEAFAGKIKNSQTNPTAFEHRTLTESPIQNALALAETLPQNCELHLVTHSRGGLIGDLLSLGGLTKKPGFTGTPADRDALDRLIALLTDRNIRVTRFARVASPSRGTTLASGRADRWLSMLLSVFGLALGQLPVTPILSNLYDALQDFIVAVAHERTDPATLPGLEAMLPGSSLVKFLNQVECAPESELSVIAGSTETSNLFGQLKYFAVDQFYGGKHDLVVNCDSMDGGPRRRRARIYSDSGPQVNHFHYFLNPKTRSAILSVLSGEDNETAGFSPLAWTDKSIPSRSTEQSVASNPSPSAPEQKIRVAVVHGDLTRASHPIAIGHYEGDSIAGAEAALDRLSNGRLRLHHSLGVYPDRIGTSEIFLRNGPIVIGLGRIGDLTAKLLEQTYKTALIRFSLAAGTDSLSTLLIGTMANVLSLEESLNGMLRAVRDANRVTSSPIRCVEIVELWEDRAIEAALAMLKLAETPEWKNVLDPAPEVEIRDGGLRRYAALDDTDDGWWGRLRITQKNPQKPLHFALIINRARTEIETVREPQRAAVLLAAAMGSTSNDDRISKALFEMLLPQRLKEYAPALSRLVLMLDKHSAGYPWELLEDRLGRRQRPLAVEAGLIRQLDIKSARTSPWRNDAQTALVVGSPETTIFAPLPGAALEAREVAAALAGAGISVTSHIEANAAAIRTSLYSAGYRILHFAGHGVLTGGLVLGDHDSFTTAEAGQLRPAPELVFINCCHLGRTDVAASNLAAGFIEQGVRAVIAAGWAVDDEAARTFALTFYGQFLRNEMPFGDAVREARLKTYESHPQVNTWGAFQCYGDPGYRFRQTIHASEIPTNAMKFVMPSQLALAIENLARRAKITGRADLQTLQNSKINSKWWTHPEVLAALSASAFPTPAPHPSEPRP